MGYFEEWGPEVLWKEKARSTSTPGGHLNAEYSKCICFAKQTDLEILQGGCLRAVVAGKCLKEACLVSWS